MKTLLIIHVAGCLGRILHEVAQDSAYRVAAVVTASAATLPHGFSVHGDLAAVDELLRRESFFFVCGDEQMLNQRRLAAYMEIKRKALPIVALKSPAASVAPGIKLRENSYLDRGVRALTGASIGANSWIMRDSELGVDSQVGSSCWIGEHCHISDRATLGKNCTLGDHVVIGPDVSLPAWSRIQSGSHIMQSPATTLFTDSRFRSPVHLFDRPVPA